MSKKEGTLADLIDQLYIKAPEYLDIMVAETDEEFEKAFDSLLENAIEHLEKNKEKFKDLDEEGLSAVFAAYLSMPGFSVTQEAYSNGHVDLTIECDHCFPSRKKLGEAKIYNGPTYHIKGIEQLLGRYTTGREGRGLLIVYVRKANISGLIKKLRGKLDEELPFDQKGNTLDHIIKWSFISTHGHSCGEDLQLGHIGCNLYSGK